MSLKEFDAADGHAQTETTAAVDQFAVVDLNLIATSRTNPRKTFNEAKMQDLAESIRASGVHQPILLRPLPSNRLEDTFRNRGDGNPLPTYELVSGERRYRASKIAGQPTIPAMIRQLSDAAVLEIQIVENLQRDDLSELEEAEGYQLLCDETGIAKDKVGERIGKSRSYVYGRMKLLELTSAPREALRTGDIDGSKALLIARIPDEKLQIKALEAATEKDHQGSPRLSYARLRRALKSSVPNATNGGRPTASSSSANRKAYTSFSTAARPATASTSTRGDSINRTASVRTAPVFSLHSLERPHDRNASYWRHPRRRNQRGFARRTDGHGRRSPCPPCSRN
ncbi:ParB/RepB/Spo0J family partition protein [Variovorax sp. PAMC26660]|uniref:ParB/RepB/Spo0J family partition protein n=1 Tax=Variovorax sp. PAMC26660 TaxID=2762322 RepID=UPI00164E5F3D|nr:ParB/RepB/Spo0J family partition protein [Variovorax sp. PAMC26660]QNK67835.1 ParB/RepB/Spo0J family partition protein [Variovorax sp. PAMC26660]